MALSETQFEAFKEQLRKKKEELGDDAYNDFVTGVTGTNNNKSAIVTPKPTVPFPATSQETPLQAGLKSAGNVPSSGFNFLKNIASAVTNPVDTGKGVFNAITGGGRAIQSQVQKGAEKIGLGNVFKMGENERADETFGALKQSLLNRYGSTEKAERTAIEDPIGFGADVVAILAGTNVLSKVDDINTIAKQSILQKTSGMFDDIAVGQMQKAINLNPSDIRKIKEPNIAGKDPANWLLERGFKGSQEQIVSQLNNHSFSSKLQVDEGLKAIITPIPATEALSARNTLQVLKNTFEGTLGNEALVKSLDDLLTKDSYTLSELNDIKRLADNELKIFKTTGALKESATAKGLFNVRDELKTLIENKAAENGFDTVKQLNKETQVAREISDAMSKRLDVESKLPNLGLRDAILATGGFAVDGLGTALGLVISKKVLESPQFRTYLANKLSTAPAGDITRLNEAVANKRYVEVIQYLAPVVNEFEISQKEFQESEEEPQILPLK